jgi:hypothetical protein
MIVFRQPSNFETVDSLYSIDASASAANFGDNSDVEQDVSVDGGGYNDYVADDD